MRMSFSCPVNRHGDRYLEYQILIFHHICHAIKSVVEVSELGVDFQGGSPLSGWLSQLSANRAPSDAAEQGWLK